MGLWALAVLLVSASAAEIDAPARRLIAEYRALLAPVLERRGSSAALARAEQLLASEDANMRTLLRFTADAYAQGLYAPLARVLLQGFRNDPLSGAIGERYRALPPEGRTALLAELSELVPEPALQRLMFTAGAVRPSVILPGELPGTTMEHQVLQDERRMRAFIEQRLSEQSGALDPEDPDTPMLRRSRERAAARERSESDARIAELERRPVTAGDYQRVRDASGRELYMGRPSYNPYSSSGARRSPDFDFDFYSIDYIPDEQGLLMIRAELFENTDPKLYLFFGENRASGDVFYPSMGCHGGRYGLWAFEQPTDKRVDATLLHENDEQLHELRRFFRFER